MTSPLDGLPAPAAGDTGAILPPSSLSLTFEPGPHRVLARVSGEIDMDDAEGLRKDLSTALDSSRDGLDVDLSAVTFCDSQGLHVLLDLNRLAAKTGKSLVLTALSRPVAHLLDVSGTDRLLKVRGRPDPKHP
ncbi:STAS domain-containing protein [Streptomyces sp. NPDC089915]|uniref:STAS domain-containing protein n=1 Tax=Streptomyces sp. NPDC089915 TaxID=3155186 RepID=UPI00342F231B